MIIGQQMIIRKQMIIGQRWAHYFNAHDSFNVGQIFRSQQQVCTKDAAYDTIAMHVFTLSVTCLRFRTIQITLFTKLLLFNVYTNVHCKRVHLSRVLTLIYVTGSILYLLSFIGNADNVHAQVSL